nr:hypothetical protein CFP56_20304 [Quercus suber]
MGFAWRGFGDYISCWFKAMKLHELVTSDYDSESQPYLSALQHGICRSRTSKSVSPVYKQPYAISQHAEPFQIARSRPRSNHTRSWRRHVYVAAESSYMARTSPPPDRLHGPDGFENAMFHLHSRQTRRLAIFPFSASSLKGVEDEGLPAGQEACLRGCWLAFSLEYPILERDETRGHQQENPRRNPVPFLESTQGPSCTEQERCHHASVYAGDGLTIVGLYALHQRAYRNALPSACDSHFLLSISSHSSLCAASYLRRVSRIFLISFLCLSPISVAKQISSELVSAFLLVSIILP